jgi:hypothetical protein
MRGIADIGTIRSYIRKRNEMKNLITTALLLTTGCAHTFQAKRTATSSECSTSRAWWIADAVGVAAGVLAVTAAIVNDVDPAFAEPMTDRINSTQSGIMGGVGGVGAVLYTASMVNGIRARRECVSGTGPVETASR